MPHTRSTVPLRNTCKSFFATLSYPMALRDLWFQVLAYKKIDLKIYPTSLFYQLALQRISPSSSNDRNLRIVHFHVLSMKSISIHCNLLVSFMLLHFTSVCLYRKSFSFRWTCLLLNGRAC
ncbi:hypothetical protein CDL12_07086 [Handroanthus impetiginosus]|uniref:Uncharacterized protein n=1 Tax=Handroanthus impetiginosus TaxID=429701 RepID=A0A2G9HRS6_9LAMI|nr:hypothetical protein CDL12_07086 [Handroanthus impetiginosus]